jgi:hypothetical protein
VANGPAATTLDELSYAYEHLRASDGGQDDRPVLIVTSAYHTRRAAVYWSIVSSGSPRAVVHGGWEDPFDPSRWWTNQRWINIVVREYLGLANYLADFPLSRRPAQGADPAPVSASAPVGPRS